MKFVKLTRRAVLTTGIVLFVSSPTWTQTRPIATQGGILIDGTGRPALEDVVLAFQEGRVREVGKREASTQEQKNGRSRG
jgi:hypothetical protein